MPRKRTQSDFIERAREVHGDKYDYSKAVYHGSNTKLCIICPKHGEFWQTPSNHVSRKCNCPKCKNEVLSNTFRFSNEEFIRKAAVVHNGKYDYSKVEYQNTDKKVCIICPEHGEFWQSPHNHLNGAGCPWCSNNHVPTTEEFIAESKLLFGDKYDYSKTVYVNSKEKVCIICPEHGEFWVTPNNHISSNQGCPKCRGNYGIDKKYFIQKATETFNGKYDYSKVEWKGYKRKVCIVCPEHGEFWQTPLGHLKNHGCPKCSGKYLDKDFFIEKARMIHGNKYDYSKVEYHGNKTPVCIICPEHGEFFMKPNGHLLGHGCPKCYHEATRKRLTKTADNFISIASKVHEGKYDYSQMVYVNRGTPIKIICQTHGAFMQTPKSHIRGSGCPMCNNSLLEDTVTRLLKRFGISFVPQKSFAWLFHNGTLHLDFYLPEHNIAIECQGIQHFQPVEFWGGEEGLRNTQERDQAKRSLCEQHGIRLLYFSNLGIKYPYNVIQDPERLIMLIESKGKTDAPIWLPEPELPFPE